MTVFAIFKFNDFWYDLGRPNSVIKVKENDEMNRSFRTIKHATFTFLPCLYQF